jgi:hypothetical protein
MLTADVRIVQRRYILLRKRRKQLFRLGFTTCMTAKTVFSPYFSLRPSFVSPRSAGDDLYGVLCGLICRCKQLSVTQSKESNRTN